MTDYERGVEQASAIYKEVIREYVAENAKLRELLSESLMDYKLYAKKYGLPPYFSDVNEHLDARMRELGIEVDG